MCRHNALHNHSVLEPNAAGGVAHLKVDKLDGAKVAEGAREVLAAHAAFGSFAQHKLEEETLSDCGGARGLYVVGIGPFCSVIITSFGVVALLLIHCSVIFASRLAPGGGGRRIGRLLLNCRRSSVGRCLLHPVRLFLVHVVLFHHECERCAVELERLGHQLVAAGGILELEEDGPLEVLGCDVAPQSDGEHLLGTVRGEERGELVDGGGHGKGRRVHAALLHLSVYLLARAQLRRAADAQFIVAHGELLGCLEQLRHGGDSLVIVRPPERSEQQPHAAKRDNQ
mmetsp:Transcript_38015/g.94284  ORF Transcript_38015/g.94284 Transcript_38015/m.94284 type:complete len:284 (+) Transcript_38015:89-940(+)